MSNAALELRYNDGATTIGLPVLVLVMVLGILVLGSGSPIGLFVGIVFIAAGAYGAQDYWKRRHDRGTVVRIGPDGILDRRLWPNLIRWEHIAAIEVRETLGPSPIPFLDLRLRGTARVRAPWHAVLWRIAGARGFPVFHHGLGGTFNQMLRASSYFAEKRGMPFVD